MWIAISLFSKYCASKIQRNNIIETVCIKYYHNRKCIGAYMNLSKIILTYCQCCCCLNSNTHMLHNLILYACDGNIEPTQYYIETIMDAHIYLSYVWMIRFKHNLGEKQNKGSINTTIASQYYHTLHSYRSPVK